ncbi:MAG: prephenate/arogenate dehydrogenase family protein [Alphaproteobacteria bacterium]|nr:prephenate/arogenate dehydrogenase family protein [Alphaproteobacteria bacterium]
MAERPVFRRLALIGVGQIGASLASAARKFGLAGEIVGSDLSPEVRKRALELGLARAMHESPAAAVAGADCVMLCSPLGTYKAIVEGMAASLAPGAILTDVGSVKGCVFTDIGALVPPGVHLIPGHPVAGTEKSGPDAANPDLFAGRWAILTPPPGVDPGALERLKAFWAGLGSLVEIMDAARHDLTLAITSHLPHLIAYTIVGTAAELETVTEADVIRYSAGGFRDFTRIAASDPVMWRDVFLDNREAVLEMLGRFNEDLTALQRAIRYGDGKTLEEWFSRTRAIRRAVIDAKQA